MMKIYTSMLLFGIMTPALLTALLYLPIDLMFVIGVMFTYLFVVGFIICRCPRCGSLTWTWRFRPGVRGWFNQFVLPIPPFHCSYCGLSYLKHRLNDRSVRQVDRRKFWVD